MQKCPYNNSCIKPKCDFSCGEFAELEHWMNRCGLTVKNPAVRASKDEIDVADSLIAKSHSDLIDDSAYCHLAVYCGGKSQYIADLTAYVAICKYCKNIGFYNGVYKLNFASYLEEIKKSWNNRNNNNELDDVKLWISSSKYLIIHNLGLVRFGDFESQTLLSIFQERYDDEKYTLVFLEKGQFSLPGKSDSIFYSKLKAEISSRGVRV